MTATIYWIYSGATVAKHRKAKANRKEESIRIRLTDAQKGLFTAAAEIAGLDLSNWIRSVLTREAKTAAELKR